MARKKIVDLPLEKLKILFYVRNQLNEDRVRHLMELYKSGTKVDPLWVSPIAGEEGEYEIVEGRHRREALERLNRAVARCEIVTAEDRIALMGMGFKANVGGKLPPSRSDTVSMMKLLIESGGTQKRIIAMFSDVFRPSLSRQYLKEAFTEAYKARLRRAISAVTDQGMTVAEAAEKHSIDIKRLQEEIQGKKRRAGPSRLTDIKGSLSQRYKGNTMKTWNVLKGLLSRFEDGDLSERQVADVFDHVEHLLKHGFRSFQDWKGRFDALKAMLNPETTSPSGSEAKHDKKAAEIPGRATQPEKSEIAEGKEALRRMGIDAADQEQ